VFVGIFTPQYNLILPTYFILSITTQWVILEGSSPFLKGLIIAMHNSGERTQRSQENIRKDPS
jgi:hypothetical protein